MLDAKQRKFLSAEASKGVAAVQLGKGGASEAFVAQLEAHLASHELVRVRFVDFKEGRREISAELARRTGSELVRVIGNTALFYRPDPEPERRKVLLPR